MSSSHDAAAGLLLEAFFLGSSAAETLWGPSTVTTPGPLGSAASQQSLLLSSAAPSPTDAARACLLKKGSLGDRSSDEAVSLASHSTVSSVPSSSSTLETVSPSSLDTTADLTRQLLFLSHPLLSCLPLEHTIVADRRRAFHKTQLCRHLASGYCRNGLNCPFAHSEEELRPPPYLSKTMMCPAVKAGEVCPRLLASGSCTFAHTRQELRRTANHYKTNMCRSWLSGNCLKNDRCTHAHGELELLLYRHRALQLGRRDFFDEREAARGGNQNTTRQTPKSFVNSPCTGTGERPRGGQGYAHKQTEQQQQRQQQRQQQQQQQLMRGTSTLAEGAPNGWPSRGGASGRRGKQCDRNSSKRSL